MLQDHFVLKGEILSHMTDEEFFHFCEENANLKIERNSNLEIVIMSPTGGGTGINEGSVIAQLFVWNQLTGLGVVFPSSTAFRLQDRSVLSPDASWISLERWNALSAEDQESFPPLSPDFVVEIRSKTDSLKYLKEKMEVYLRNGTSVGVLIDPQTRTSYVWRAGSGEIEYAGFERNLTFEPMLPGFALDLHLMK